MKEEEGKEERQGRRVWVQTNRSKKRGWSPVERRRDEVQTVLIEREGGREGVCVCALCVSVQGQLKKERRVFWRGKKRKEISKNATNKKKGKGERSLRLRSLFLFRACISLQPHRGGKPYRGWCLREEGKPREVERERESWVGSWLAWRQRCIGEGGSPHRNTLHRPHAEQKEASPRLDCGRIAFPLP